MICIEGELWAPELSEEHSTVTEIHPHISLYRGTFEAGSREIKEACKCCRYLYY